MRDRPAGSYLHTEYRQTLFQSKEETSNELNAVKTDEECDRDRNNTWRREGETESKRWSKDEME